MLLTVRDCRTAAAEAAKFLQGSPPGGRVFVVAGSRSAADDVVRQACTGSLAGVSRFSVPELVAALSERTMYTSGLAPLHSAPREALLAGISRETSLGYLKEVARFPGFGRALARTLGDLRLNRIEPVRLRNCGRSGPDLALLMQRFNDELQTRGLADYAGRVEMAIGTAATLDPAPALLVIDPGELSATEEEVLQTVRARASKALWLSIAPPQLPREIEFLSASSEALEFDEIARRVLHAGIPFDRCAVMLRNAPRHLPLLEEAFNRAGIPVFFERSLRRPDRNARGFLALLSCRGNNFSAADFCEYLALATLPHEEEQKLSEGWWEALLDDAAVVDGHERWQSRLAAAIERANEEYDQTPSSGLAKRIDALESLRGFAVPLIERLAALPERAPWRAWMTALGALAEASLHDARVIRNALDALAPVADLDNITFDAVQHTLESLIGDRTEEDTGARYGKVFAAPLESARGMHFDLVFVPGLNEGLFPRPDREDPLLLDVQRNGLGLPARMEERKLLNVALSSCERKSVFSWSAVDLATGRERVHSFFAAELLAATGGTVEEATSRIGWSAPLRPEDSIDDTEFDLSCFRHSAKTGESMSWLAAVNPHTLPAVHARKRRWSRDWSEADGIDTDFDFEAGSQLANYRLTQREWSATALNQFARCPYRFYLYSVLRLRRRERPEPFACLDPLTRGRIFHRSLERYFAGDQQLELAQIVEEEAASEMDRQAPSVPGIWRLEVRKLYQDLQTWLSIRDPDWLPLHVEWKFHDLVLDGGWRLKGSIDLIEQHREGAIRILDHKTGKPQRRRRTLATGEGEVLQPLLYALAWEAAGHQAARSAALSWGTVRGGFRLEEVMVDLASREAVRRVLQTVDDSISRGFLPAAPRKEGCRGCEYLDVCGPYEEIRTSSKDRKQLNALMRIRSAS
ncbi:MAG TPA: PD-(D/E)XK nuclease family protein [Bryobacteraceae bacterium]|nr:PD-(D/E)XK nuclease family protein [Bryobacteraceae bacterium]